MSGLRSAVTFLTRVPIGDGRRPNIDAAPAWFPVVGLGLGAITGAVFVAGSWLAGPQVAAGLALASGALVTGAFHHDGLADMADAFGGGWTVEQRLAILKDSRHGTYGVMSLVLNCLLQLVALSAFGWRAGFVALVSAHALGRVMAVALMRFLRPVRTDGLAATAAVNLPRGLTYAVSALVLALVVIGPGLGGLILVVAAVAATTAVAGLAQRKIGGYVGDVLGAAEQVSETAVLLAAAALAYHGHPWLH